MSTTDTIVALATPAGRSPLALIRCSGPAVPEIIAEHLHASDQVKPALDPTARWARPATLDLAGRPLPVRALHAPAPRTYTGEPTLELLLPGNPHLIERVLAQLTAHATTQHTLRAAQPGEFTARAYLNGRLSLDRAEGVAATIAADSADQLAAAKRALTGTAGRARRAWADDLATLLALVEAGIDFTDQEDVVPIAPADLHARLTAIASAVREEVGQGSSSPSTTAREHPAVVLAGPTGAGKSTLFNALLGTNRAPRAITDAQPHTTRDALAEPLDLRPDAHTTVTLIDLPGTETKAAPARTPAQRAALVITARAIETADLVILCDPAGIFDPPATLDPATPTLRVRTKADLPRASTSAEDLAVCALDAYHLPALRRAIAEQAVGSQLAATAAVLPRHHAALTRTLDALRAAIETIDEPAHALADPELTAAALRDALDALGQITGTMTPDDILARVFSTFCVGK